MSDPCGGEQSPQELRAAAIGDPKSSRPNATDGGNDDGGGDALATADHGREPFSGVNLSHLVESDLRSMAGCVDEEADMIGSAIDEIQHSREPTGLRKWIQCLREELDEAVRASVEPRDSSRCWILEVFCSSESQLTRQGQRLGVPCERFGLSQGDLSTREGRLALCKRLILGRPHHIWFSPECSPWCAWNRLNAGRSLAQLKSGGICDVAFGPITCDP